jgi:hypothetical protein
MVGAAKFSPDGQVIASCGRDLPVRIWDSATGQEIASLEGPPGDYHEDWLIQFSPEGRWIYSGKESSLKAWETPAAIQRRSRASENNSRAVDPEKAPGTVGSTPTVPAARVPPAGPARGARNVRGEWIVQRDQLIMEGGGFGFVGFGDLEWSDYDLTFEARKSAGQGGFGACFRTAQGKQYLLMIGDPREKYFLRIEERSGDGRWIPRELGSKPGTIQPLEWYKLKISLLGPHIRIELDDHLLFAVTDESHQKGRVQLRGTGDGAQFRNIKVSAPDGTVLWEGLPDLPYNR